MVMVGRGFFFVLGLDSAPRTEADLVWLWAYHVVPDCGPLVCLLFLMRKRGEGDGGEGGEGDGGGGAAGGATGGSWEGGGGGGGGDWGGSGGVAAGAL
jgi:hypothetical protein